MCHLNTLVLSEILSLFIKNFKFLDYNAIFSRKMHQMKSVSLKYYFSNFEIVSINEKNHYFTAIYPDISIIQWNTNWTFIQSLTRFELGKHPSYMKVIDSKLFISTDEILFKATLNEFDILKSFEKKKTWYRGIYYNETNKEIYICAQPAKSSIRDLTQKADTEQCNDGIITSNGNSIDIFNTDLNFKDSIDLRNNTPYRIIGKNGILYVGTNEGKILIIKNRQIDDSFYTHCNKIIGAILADQNGYLVVGCFCKCELYLYASNGAAVRKIEHNMTSPCFISDLKFDDKNRLVVLTTSYSYQSLESYY